MPIDLPTGKTPGWELDVSDDDSEPTNVVESCVVLHSLRQSREQWMYFVFPRFSGRVRGKPEAVPPPHTLHFRGRCQIEIGPHVFSETSFYEAQYLPTPTAPPSTQSSWQSSPYNSSYVPYGLGGQVPVPQNTSPLLSSLSSVTAITPNLINQVNAAAASNPTLANLLQLAAAGKGTAEQLKTLGLLVQSLASPESSEAISAANSMPSSSAQPYPPVAPTVSVKEFDLVFQYYETAHERWVLPRVPVICEKVADTRTPGLTYDIVLTMALPSPRVAEIGVDAGKLLPQVVTTIRLRRPPPAIWETIWRWVGGEDKFKENRILIDNLKKNTERAYLAHQIPQNSLLAQLQNATASNYVMKPIKPGPVVVPKAKRKPAQRKPPQPAQPQTAPQASGSGIPAATWASTSTLPPATATSIQGSSAPTPPDPKRRKTSKPKQTLPLRCVSCQQTDVPLILGGRFCRPCVDSGKATTVYVPYKPQQNAYQQNMPVAPVYAQAAARQNTLPPPG
ncbi:hypothetical protein C8R46DRAFT_1091085 [Mycena filopes]|nr:hypothetical protein C8R46DRAFT_1091085 [Mycena filopes]